MAAPANSNAQPTRRPTQKTVAATGGSAIGAAIATLVIFLIEGHGGEKLPAPVSDAIMVLIPAAVSFIAGYFTPPGATEGVVLGASGKATSAR